MMVPQTRLSLMIALAALESMSEPTDDYWPQRRYEPWPAVQRRGQPGTADDDKRDSRKRQRKARAITRRKRN